MNDEDESLVVSERAHAWKIDWKALSKPGKLIYSSHDGTSAVRRCKLHEKFDVAVKIIGENRRLGTRIDLVDADVSKLVTLSHHERLVWFMGCGREDDFIFVVTEYAEKGTLSDLLWSKKKRVSIRTRMDLLLDVRSSLFFVFRFRHSI